MTAEPSCGRTREQQLYVPDQRALAPVEGCFRGPCNKNSTLNDPVQLANTLRVGALLTKGIAIMLPIRVMHLK